MIQSRFIALSFLRSHKHLPEGLDLLSVANGFASLNDVRYNYFGTFKKIDISNKYMLLVQFSIFTSSPASSDQIDLMAHPTCKSVESLNRLKSFCVTHFVLMTFRIFLIVSTPFQHADSQMDGQHQTGRSQTSEEIRDKLGVKCISIIMR